MKMKNFGEGTFDECMGEIRGFMVDFHNKIDRCPYRKVRDGTIFCSKKMIQTQWNNLCVNCEFLPVGDDR
jgi:hypothetical protein